MAELLARISSRELTEWMLYYQVEPFGEERGDLRSAVVAATVANTQRGKKGRPFKPAAFMPQFEKARQEHGWEEQLQVVEMLNAAFGGEDRREPLPPASTPTPSLPLEGGGGEEEM